MPVTILRKPYILCPHVIIKDNGEVGYMHNLYRLHEGTLCLCYECDELLSDQALVNFLIWHVPKKHKFAFINNLKRLFKK